MITLAIETATDACSVALDCDGEISSRHAIAPRRHGDLVLNLIDEMLLAADRKRADIDMIAYGCGPGTFSGVRIAAALTQGIASARDLPVIAVSTLAALAAGAARVSGNDKILVATDARRAEVYVAAYTFGHAATAPAIVMEDTLCAPAQFTVPTGDGWVRAGNGWEVYATAFAAAVNALPLLDYALPDARDVALLARHAVTANKTAPCTTALPRYWRGAVG